MVFSAADASVSFRSNFLSAASSSPLSMKPDLSTSIPSNTCAATNNVVIDVCVHARKVAKAIITFAMNGV